jgi:hypothetical protein
MKDTYKHDILESWLKQNKKRFCHLPSIVKRENEKMLIRFKGLARELECFMSSSGIAVDLKYSQWGWCNIKNFDLKEHTTNGRDYYCEFCLSGMQEFYSSREALWSEHCFEPFLSWVNETFDSSSIAFLVESDKGCCKILKNDFEITEIMKYNDPNRNLIFLNRLP